MLDKLRTPSYNATAPSAAEAQVAQLVEHATENRSVGGSIPPLGTKALVPAILSWSGELDTGGGPHAPSEFDEPVPAMSSGGRQKQAEDAWQGHGPAKP